MICYARFRDGWVLFRVIWMFYNSCAIGVTQTTLNILPKIMEVHDLVVLKLVLIDTHLLVVDLLEACGPLIRLCQ